MNTMRTAFLTLVVLLFAFTGLAMAQDTDTAAEPDHPPTTVYVTTQDFVALRQGPGTGFNRLTVVPAVVTLPAYGRTSDTRWIQVLHEGRLGWIAAQYLVWSGDVIDLPVDGVNPYPFVRRAAALGVTTRETPIYRSDIVPGAEVGLYPGGDRGRADRAAGRPGLLPVPGALERRTVLGGQLEYPHCRWRLPAACSTWPTCTLTANW